ncbi:MAG: hypothetical protein NC431_06260 [Firmicutes bacterium]|nr:hypothetical protein [Bacteroidales bacterium]MCM1206258.1 hypothetical protein [Bacillota bacterium]
MIISKIIKWVKSMCYYVIADPADNSVTLSRKLFEHIRKNAKESDVARVFVFKIAGTSNYAFCVNPALEKPTQMCDIQYNGKYRCIGFETLCPSVGCIFYNYGLPSDRRIKLSVLVQHAPDGMIYYQLCKPDAKHFRKHT